MAGIPTMTCIVQEGAIAPGELLTLQLIENLMREDLRPLEQAKAFQGLMGLNGWSVRQLARELAIDHSGVIRALALLDLPATIRGQVEAGSLTPATAYEVSKIGDPTAQVDLAARVVAEGLSRAETAEVVHRAPGRKGKARKLTSRTVRTPAGRVTIDNARGLTPELMRAALDAARAALDVEVGMFRDEASGVQ